MNRVWVRSLRFLGDYLIVIVFLLLCASLFASFWGRMLFSSFYIQVLAGGYIGGITNKIAIRMLFEKAWYLPGSGVLLKKQREIIESLATTVDEHLINSEMIQNELRRLLAPLRIEKVETILNQVINDFRDDVREFLRSGKVHGALSSFFCKLTSGLYSQGFS